MSPNGVSTMSPDKTLDRAIQYPRSVFTGSPIEIGCFRFRSFNSAEVGQARLRVKPGDDSIVGFNLIEKCSSAHAFSAFERRLIDPRQRAPSGQTGADQAARAWTR